MRQVPARKPERVAGLVWRDGERLFVPVPLGYSGNQDRICVLSRA